MNALTELLSVVWTDLYTNTTAEPIPPTLLAATCNMHLTHYYMTHSTLPFKIKLRHTSPATVLYSIKPNSKILTGVRASPLVLPENHVVKVSKSSTLILWGPQGEPFLAAG